MSEAIEIYASLKAVRADKRLSNRLNGLSALSRIGVKFESKNDGAHLVIKDFGVSVDYWPGTGLWIVRGRERKQRGLRGLVNFLENKRSLSGEPVFVVMDLTSYTKAVNALLRDRVGRSGVFVYDEDSLRTWYEKGASVELCMTEVMSSDESNVVDSMGEVLS